MKLLIKSSAKNDMALLLQLRAQSGHRACFLYF